MLMYLPRGSYDLTPPSLTDTATDGHVAGQLRLTGPSYLVGFPSHFCWIFKGKK